MKKVATVSGQDLRDMFATATSWLEKNSADIDALNVFPVPDGDTGTNMMLTMRSTVEESHRAPDHSATAVAQAMAKGALMGARGNSGVILSQILRGLAQSLNGKDTFTGKDLAEALQQAAQAAYKGISNPVEGTILTVMKDAAQAASERAAVNNADVVAVMEAAVNAAAQSVANTPRLLKVLRDAGVVDAGGQGLYTILEGSLRYLKGEREEMRLRKPQIIVSEIPVAAKMRKISMADEVPYGYCTEFMIKGERISADRLRKKLAKKGQSLIVVGDESAVRVHVHTLDPGEIVSYATSLGTLHQVSIRNMDEQHQDFLEMQKEKGPVVDTAMVAVVAGDGFADVFASLGVAAIVPGGQTMNPSTKDILQSIESVAADNVILLPNNKNIIPTANQVQSLTKKTIELVPTETIPQGIAALLAFDYEANMKTNVQLMKKAITTVRSIEITRAIRATRVGNLRIKRKQPIGILDGDLVATGETILAVLKKILAKLDLSKAEVLTIYYGADTKVKEAEEISQNIREQYPRLQIEVLRGGQPHYNYIISVE